MPLLEVVEQELESSRRNTGAPAWIGKERFHKASSEEIERHIPLARHVIKTRGYGEALSYEEKLSIGMIGIAVALERFDPTRNVKLSSWIAYQIDKALRNEIRYELRQRRGFASGADGFEASVPTRSIDPVDAEIQKEENARLVELALESLNELDQRSQRVVRGVILEGKSQEEVGREIGATQSWTSRIMLSALAKIKKKVALRRRESTHTLRLAE